jgi:ABC-type nitrate/sulfonate/bicarbonate transport system substrate-binding protein
MTVKQDHLIPASSTAAQLAAMQASRVDCSWLASPVAQLAGDSLDQIFSVDVRDEGPAGLYTGYLSAGMVATDDFAAKNPDVVRRTSRALRDASKLIADPTKSDDIATRVAEFFPNVPHSILAQAIKDASRASNGYVTIRQLENSLGVYNTVNPTAKLAVDTKTLTSYISGPVRDEISNPPAH